MVRRICLALLTAGLLPVFSSGRCIAQERIALVIGNGKYEGVGMLRNPANDAAAMSATLRKLGFAVTTKIDVDLVQLEDAVVQFRRSLKKGSVALFFYAGHGLQVRGENFLLPINSRLKEEFEVNRKCYGVDQVIGAMEESESSLKVIILDCCRDNPFTRSWKRNGAKQGIAAIADIPDGTVIAFATAPGKTASDGRPDSKNSPYTAHLVASLNSRPTGGLELIEALREASRTVKQETNQVPWVNFDASLDRFFLWREAGLNSSAPRYGVDEGGLVPAPPPPIFSSDRPTPPSAAPQYGFDEGAPPPAPPRVILSTDQPAPPATSSPLKRVAMYRAGQVRDDNSLKLKLVYCPAGAFKMGSPLTEKGRDQNERQVSVKLTRGFWLGKFEITQAHWTAVMGTSPWRGDKETKSGVSYAACYVSWDDAITFCERFTAIEREAGRLGDDQQYALPTEAQWEYACRAGTTSPFSFKGKYNDYLWYGGFGEGNAVKEAYPHPVGTKKPNAWGLYDMHGNVNEWCRDFYQERLLGGTDPLLDLASDTRVLRGGGWFNGVLFCRSAARKSYESTHRCGNDGFRIAIVGQ